MPRKTKHERFDIPEIMLETVEFCISPQITRDELISDIISAGLTGIHKIKDNGRLEEFIKDFKDHKAEWFSSNRKTIYLPLEESLVSNLEDTATSLNQKAAEPNKSKKKVFSKNALVSFMTKEWIDQAYSQEITMDEKGCDVNLNQAALLMMNEYLHQR